MAIPRIFKKKLDFKHESISKIETHAVKPKEEENEAISLIDLNLLILLGLTALFISDRVTIFLRSLDINFPSILDV